MKYNLGSDDFTKSLAAIVQPKARAQMDSAIVKDCTDKVGGVLCSENQKSVSPII